MAAAVKAFAKKQIEFYFCDSNLPKDRFLLGEANKDEDKDGEGRGWVALELLCSFSRMSQKKGDMGEADFVALVAEALEPSATVELNDAKDKIRRKEPLPGKIDQAVSVPPPRVSLLRRAQRRQRVGLTGCTRRTRFWTRARSTPRASPPWAPPSTRFSSSAPVRTRAPCLSCAHLGPDTQADGVAPWLQAPGWAPSRPCACATPTTSHASSRARCSSSWPTRRRR